MSPKFRQTAQKELLSFWSLAIIFIFASSYICFSLFLLNYRLFWDTVSGSFPIVYKFTVLFDLLQGSWTGLSHVDFFLLLINALLIAGNILLIGKTIYHLEHGGKLRVSVGGATIIALVTTGCTSCGLSLLSILGLSASFSFLPLQGLGIHILATTLLLFSFWYMLKKLHEEKYCKIPRK